MNKIIYLLILITISFACTKEIVIEQTYYESKIVVDGWIANNDYANVILTKSSPFLTDYDSASIRNTFLNYAKVTVTSSKGESEVLTLFRKDEFFPPFVYRTIDIRGEVGVKYDLKVEVDNEIISSSTYIPEIPIIQEVNVNIISDSTMNFTASIIDDENVLNYYYTQIYIKNINRNFHSTAFPLFNDINNNGKVIDKTIYRSIESDPLNLNEQDTSRNLPRYEFARDDTVFLRILSVDLDSYNVLSDIYLDQSNSTNPFSFVNKNTSTNIDGGIGRWTGLGTQEFIITE